MGKMSCVELPNPRTLMPSKDNQNLDATLQQAIDLYHAGDLAAAASLLRSASARFPNSAKLWGYLGFLQKERGSHDAAVASFKKATRISPASEKSSLGLFFSLWRAGKPQAAFNEMVRYIRFGEPKEYLDLLRQ